MKKKKRTQADFEKKIGVTQGIKSYYINGRGMPTRKNMRKIINITGGMVTADDFCFEDSGDGND